MMREVKDSNYEGLMVLYMQLHDDPFPENQTAGVDLWGRVLADECHRVIVAEEDGEIVFSCVCVVILNLTHVQQPCILIGNAITDSDYRKKGLATTCLHYTKEVVVNENCYKIMLLTRIKMKSTLNSYK